MDIQDAIFTHNAAAGNGGAITTRFGGETTIANSKFIENTAGASGGAIDNFGGFFGPYGSLDIADSLFSGNSAGSGAAIWNDGPAKIAGSTFSQNSARVFGGAIAHRRNPLSINGSTFSNNSASIGGAIDISSRALVTVTNSALWTNSAIQEGGAIENFGGTLEIANSTLSGNTSAGQGGGIWNLGGLMVTNATLTANRADADGNGLGEGGGLYLRASTLFPVPRLNNTIVAGNVRGAHASAGPDDIAGLVDLGSSHNLIGAAATAGGLTDGVNGNIVGNAGVGTIDIALILDASLADNGGPTLTHALLPGSIAVDGGDNALAGGATDQRGAARFHDGDGDGTTTVDIGAYEWVAAADLIATLSQRVDSLGDAGILGAAQEKLLLTLLAQAQANFDRADPVASAQGLAAFIRQINRYVELGILTEAAAQELTDLADFALHGIHSKSTHGVDGSEPFSGIDELFDLDVQV